MGIHQHRLCILIADHTDAAVALELVQLVFKAGTEVFVFQIVYTAQKSAFLTVRSQSTPSRSEM